MPWADEDSLGPLQSLCCSLFSTPVCCLRLEDRDRLPVPLRNHLIVLYSPGPTIACPLPEALHARSCAFPILRPPQRINAELYDSSTLYFSAPYHFLEPVFILSFLSTLGTSFPIFPCFSSSFLPVMLFIVFRFVVPGLSFRPSPLLSGLFPVFVSHLSPHLLMFFNYVSK